MSNHTNLFKTTLSGSYTTTDTVITVSDASGLVGFPTKLVIFNNEIGDPADAFQSGEAEIVNATSKNGNDITIERGQENTNAVALSDGWNVYQTITADTIDGKEPTFTKNTAFNKDFGDQADTVTEGNDARLSDARTPTEHGDEAHSENYIKDNDARLSDAREWTADTVTQNEAEAGTDTTRKAWTVQRVWQAINSWYDSLSIAISKVTGLQTELDGKADLEGENEFTDLNLFHSLGVKPQRFSGIDPVNIEKLNNVVAYRGSGDTDGYLILEVPKWSATFWQLEITGHASNQGFKIILTGYARAGRQRWDNSTAQVIGDVNFDNDIRFVADEVAEKFYVIIGESTSTWRNPVINVDAYEMWTTGNRFDGWNLHISQNLPNITNDRVTSTNFFGDKLISNERNILTELDGKADGFTPTTFNVEYDTEGDPFDSISYLNNEGVYTISNGFVMGQINITTSSLTIGSASGNVIITGLPEPIDGFGSAINVGAQILGFSGDYPLSGHIRNIGGSIVIRLRTYSSNSVGASNLQASNMNESSNRNQFICSFVYKLG